MRQNNKKSIHLVAIICTFLLLQGFSGEDSRETAPVQDMETQFSDDRPLTSEDETTIEYRTSFNTQLIQDQSFSQDIGTSPWYLNQTGDLGDIDSNLDSHQANFEVVGDQRTFSDVHSNFSMADWSFATHPDYPIFPDSYVLNTKGLEVQHYWAEDANQSTSVQIEKVITMPVNMSDYTITDATTSSLFNASVYANDGVNNGVDVEIDSPPQPGVYDYARFYVVISDLAGDNRFEIASNQTSYLGRDDAGVMDIITDTFMNVVVEEALILYLTTVLNADNVHFKIAVGIRIWCEDNFSFDRDNWDSLIIRNFSLDFTYEKKIDQGSGASWTESGGKIDTAGYVNATTQVDNATLNFDYWMDQGWPSISPNSEIRIYLNEFLIPETVKLTNATTSPQKFSTGGIASLIEENQNITISIQVFIADNFLMDSNKSLHIDNVSLDVGYTIVEVSPPIVTEFFTLGSLTREIPWNDTFTIFVNYTELLSKNGIKNAQYEIQWIENYQMMELENGIYQIDCNTSTTLLNQQYSLIITVKSEKFYLSKSLSVEINIVGRPTKLNVFFSELNITDSPVVSSQIMDPLNISTQFLDVGSGENIQNANISLIGSKINSSMYQINETEDLYNILIDTESLGLGTFLISLNYEGPNYQDGFSQIRIEVTPRETGLQVFLNGLNTTLYPKFDIPSQDILNITVIYRDQSSIQDLSNAIIIIEDVQYDWSVSNATHQFLVDTTQFELGPHYLSVVAELENYEKISQSIEIVVNPRETALEVLINGTNLSSFEELTVPIGRFINITTFYSDAVLNNVVPSGTVILSGLPDASIAQTEKGDKMEFTIDTLTAGIAVYFISFLGTGIGNYQQTVSTLQLNVVQIQTEIITVDANQSYLIIPGQDFDLNVVINDLDFGGLVSDCEVSYSYVLETGDLIEVEPGVYSATITDIPEGIYTITINVYKEGQLYSFHQYQITLNAISTEIQGLPTWSLYPALGLLGILGISFIAYQQYYKYPLKIRQIRSAKRAIKAGKIVAMEFKTQQDLFSETYQGVLKAETNIRLKKRGANAFETPSDKPPETVKEPSENVPESNEPTNGGNKY
ncbi:MAG: hypothetical protein ACTSWW_05760 [Promethearchaeota archaeon]